MIKKIRILTVLTLFLSLLSQVPVRAQGGLSVTNQSVVVSFPAGITFNLTAESGFDISDIRLSYVIRHESFAAVTSEAYVYFRPAPQVSASWTLEMVRIGGVPPGTVVDYFWVIKDAGSNKLTTEPGEIEFTDGRYQWKRLTRGQINLYWYEGDDSFAGELMAAAEDALVRLTVSTGATLSKPVKLYIYAGSEDLRGSMINPQEWTGGVAFTRYATIAIGISTNQLAWGKGAVVHEFTHLVVDQMTLSPYSNLPVWLNEGLAMYNEGVMGPEFTSSLSNAIANKRLISVRGLASPFSAIGSEAILSYAESFSIVSFLLEHYGSEKMARLLLTFRDGATYDNALNSVYGFDMDELNTLWQASLISPPSSGTAKGPGVFDLLRISPGTREFALQAASL